jgi:hypothetical protein
VLIEAIVARKPKRLINCANHCRAKQVRKVSRIKSTPLLSSTFRISGGEA